MIEDTRLSVLSAMPIRPSPPGRYVLYWLQASQRTRFNPALDYAIEQANQMRLPLVVCFGLMDDYPEANGRHYAFMLDGLRDIQSALEAEKILFVVGQGEPPEVALRFAAEATMVVCDRGYQRHQNRWRDQVADRAECRVVQVEGDVVVPVETASSKQEFAARTLRPKIHRELPTYLREPARVRVKQSSLGLVLKTVGVRNLDPSTPETLLAKLKVDRSVVRSPIFAGGEVEAQRRLGDFVTHRLSGYANGRREPAAGQTSRLAAYLHFGQISPLQIALAVQNAAAPATDRDAFLEELIVRRELSINFTHYCKAYDRYDGLPDWAHKTLAEHRRDKRPVIYTREQLETAATADPYWNAAQKEMTLTGFMQNSLRMYWGKKILEWTRTPQEAFEITLGFNNKYFLCGRDPASFANVGWIFGLHDRPWGRRKIFGTIRYMNAAGLKRKFDMEKYVEQVARLGREM